MPLHAGVRLEVAWAIEDDATQGAVGFEAVRVVEAL